MVKPTVDIANVDFNCILDIELYWVIASAFSAGFVLGVVFIMLVFAYIFRDNPNEME